MPERFSADEARRIFARAARRQHTAPTPDGLTVDDLIEIGRQAGLDPELVKAEAAGEHLGDGHDRTWHGVPVGIRRARLMPSRVSDREWERIVDLLRAEFKLSGVAEQIGTRREWRSGASSSSPSMSSAYSVTVEARPDGDLVTVTAPDIARQLGIGLGASFAMVGVVMTGLFGFIDADWGAAGAVLATVLALALVCYGAAWGGAKVSAVRVPARFEALLDRIDLLSRAEDAATAPMAAATPASASRLDLDRLDPSPVASASPPSSSRLRS